jgi:hypothetical protein
MIHHSRFLVALLLLLGGAVTADEIGNPTPPGAGVLSVRLEKLGYKNVILTRVGDHWEASAVKDGASQKLCLDPVTGEVSVRKPDSASAHTP